MIGVLLDLLDQSLDFSSFCEVGGDGDGLAGAGEGVEGGAGFLAGFSFAGGDEDLGAAGLEETVVHVLARRCIKRSEMMYPEAACRPSPLDPPVTTATFPLREKMLLKSFSLTSASADILNNRIVEKCVKKQGRKDCEM